MAALLLGIIVIFYRMRYRFNRLGHITEIPIANHIQQNTFHNTANSQFGPPLQSPAFPTK